MFAGMVNMAKAIKISASKAEEGYDLLASKFFGAPVIPQEWLDEFPDEVIFFAQIRLSDVAPYDEEGKLPRLGYLYLFLDTEVYPYTAWAKYYEGEPNVVVDDFNEIEPRFAHLNEAYLMTFSACEEDYEGTKLFGVPTFDLDEEGDLLMQFDPLDASMGFWEEMDGYAYFLFGEEERDWEQIRFRIERS